MTSAFFKRHSRVAKDLLKGLCLFWVMTMQLLYPKLVDTFGTVFDEAGNDFGVRVSPPLEHALLKDHLTNLQTAQKQDPRVRMMDADVLKMLLQIDPINIGYEWYHLPQLLVFTKEEGRFYARVLKNIPLHIHQRIAEEGFNMHRYEHEYVFNTEAVGLESLMAGATRRDAPDGTEKFAFEEDNTLTAFAKYPLVQDILGTAAPLVAKHSATFRNNTFFGCSTHRRLTNYLGNNEGLAVAQPVFVGPVGIYISCGGEGVNQFYCKGRSRLVVIEAKK